MPNFAPAETAALAALVAEATGAPITAVTLTPRPALSYANNQLYDAWAAGRRLIVKAFTNPAEQHGGAAREYAALRLVAPLDIAPQPVFYDAARGPVVIYSYMDGEMWDRRRPTPQQLAQLAEMWLRLNAASGEPWPAAGTEQTLAQIGETMRGRFQAYARWAAATFAPGLRAAELSLAVLESRADVIAVLDAAPPALCFCRSDPRFANVIQRPDGRLGLVDWEDSGWRDPAREVADLQSHPNQEDLLAAEDWQAFLRPYLAGRGSLDAGLAQRAHWYLALFPIYFLSSILSRGLALAQRGQLAGWDVNGLPPNQRARRYLARARAWPEAAFEPELARLEAAAVQFFPER